MALFYPTTSIVICICGVHEKKHIIFTCKLHWIIRFIKVFIIQFVHLYWYDLRWSKNSITLISIEKNWRQISSFPFHCWSFIAFTIDMLSISFAQPQIVEVCVSSTQQVLWILFNFMFHAMQLSSFH